MCIQILYIFLNNYSNKDSLRLMLIAEFRSVLLFCFSSYVNSLCFNRLLGECTYVAVFVSLLMGLISTSALA